MPSTDTVPRIAFCTCMLLLSATGCAVFSDPPRPARPHVGPPAMEQLRVFVDSGYDPIEQSGLWTPYPATAQEKVALATLGRSGWFGAVDVVADAREADLTLRVERYQRWSASGSLTIVTFGILPSRWERTLKVKLVRHLPDRSTPTCVKTQSYSQWVQLFLLPFAFSHSAGDYEGIAVARLTAACSAELFRAG